MAACVATAIIESMKLAPQIKSEFLIIISEPDDFPVLPDGARVFIDRVPGCSPAVERGFMEAQYDYLVWLNDDIQVLTPDWISRAWELREKGILNFRDGIQNGGGCCVPFGMMKREWYFENIYPQPYRTYCLDREIFEIGKISCGVHYCPDIFFNHLHDWSLENAPLHAQEVSICKKRIGEWRLKHGRPLS